MSDCRSICSAQLYALTYTTIPDNTGAVTCNGVNGDSSLAQWTIGGSIAYSAYAGDYPGWGEIVPNGYNPDITAYDQNHSWQVTIHTSSNYTTGAPDMEGNVYIAYLSYSSGSSTTTPTHYSIPSGSLGANDTIQMDGDFTYLLDVKNVQFKSTCIQDVSGSPTWTAATPYLS